VVDGLTRMRERQSKVNRWRGDWKAFTRVDVAERANQPVPRPVQPSARFAAHRAVEG